ncbi:cell division protein FtsQ/DivIB [Pseudonocardia broussonetiae]|uniref:FtsQ-type POTRA domain-containing protein n=1 Tax=Pseudonocardia broussonetiae TaxID=2736640 RepID=A0A6M6JTL3_9PSEU|nr:FtsQ-type POTRA domain-containing protein [Pseudonocardia broussonetiae]QJY49531.1 FtsQ-type POTRA domain-containing protein [Pseudonocardia broussonetiae]
MSPGRTPSEGPARRRETVGEAVARRGAAGGGARPTGRARAASAAAEPGGREQRPRRTDRPARPAADGTRPRARSTRTRPAPDAPRAPRPEPSPVHRRRRRVALVVALLVLLAGLAVGVRVLVYDLGLLDVEGVEVTGAVAVPQDEVLAAAAVVVGQPLAGVDTAGIAERVAQLPGIGSVEVGRSWPHTVTVAITERTAVAVARTPQGPRPVDAAGVVYPAPVAPGLPQLTFGAVGPDDPSTRAALDVLAALPEDVRAQVLTVDVSVGGGVPQVTLGLTDDRQVRWGPVEESARKAGVLVPLLTQPGRVYDVASPELPTVRS